MSVAIRAARPADRALIFALALELADHQDLRHDFDVTPEGLAATLFAPEPRVHCDIAEWNGEPAGFALWFLHYSTFRGRYGLYLEDLFVRPAMRRRGIGKALMEQLARRCIADGYVRLEWAVLDRNPQSIEFYRSIGAQVLDQWKLCRLSGQALDDLAQTRVAQ